MKKTVAAIHQPSRAIPGNPLQTHLVSRPYYLCSRCHAGQFPVDVELDIENTEFSPGVRRMQATAGGRTEPSDNQYSITPLDKHEVGKKVDEKVRSNGEVGKPSFKKTREAGHSDSWLEVKSSV